MRYVPKKNGLENFFNTLGVGDLWVPSVSDFAGESPLKSTYFCKDWDLIDAYDTKLVILPMLILPEF